MVTLYPQKDQSWRWQTSNSEYGKFYVSIHREVVKRQEVHKDCAKKCEALGRELKDCKAQMEMMKLTSPHTCKSGPGGTTCSPRPSSPKLGNCDCPGKPGPPNPDPYVSVAMKEFNGGKRHDPQFLEDHIKAKHPRLVKRLQPKLPGTSLPKGPGDHFAKVVGEGDGGGSGGGRHQGGSDSGDEKPRHCKMVGLYKRPGSAGSDNSCGGGGGFKRKMVGMYRKDEAPAKQRKCYGGGSSSSGARPASAGANNLPPSQRYNFYRYYEKMPGFSLKDIFYDVEECSYARAINGGYLEELFPTSFCHTSECSPIQYSGGGTELANIDPRSDFSKFSPGTTLPRETFDPNGCVSITSEQKVNDDLHNGFGCPLPSVDIDSNNWGCRTLKEQVPDKFSYPPRDSDCGLLNEDRHSHGSWCNMFGRQSSDHFPKEESGCQAPTEDFRSRGCRCSTPGRQVTDNFQQESGCQLPKEDCYNRGSRSSQPGREVTESFSKDSGCQLPEDDCVNHSTCHTPGRQGTEDFPKESGRQLPIFQCPNHDSTCTRPEQQVSENLPRDFGLHLPKDNCHGSRCKTPENQVTDNFLRQSGCHSSKDDNHTNCSDYEIPEPVTDKSPTQSGGHSPKHDFYTSSYRIPEQYLVGHQTSGGELGSGRSGCKTHKQEVTNVETTNSCEAFSLDFGHQMPEGEVYQEESGSKTDDQDASNSVTRASCDAFSLGVCPWPKGCACSFAKCLIFSDMEGMNTSDGFESRSPKCGNTERVTSPGTERPDDRNDDYEVVTNIDGMSSKSDKDSHVGWCNPELCRIQFDDCPCLDCNGPFYPTQRNPVNESDSLFTYLNKGSLNSSPVGSSYSSPRDQKFQRLDPLYPNFDFDIEGRITQVGIDTPCQTLPCSSVPSPMSSPKSRKSVQWQNSLHPNFDSPPECHRIQSGLETLSQARPISRIFSPLSSLSVQKLGQRLDPLNPGLEVDPECDRNKFEPKTPCQRGTFSSVSSQMRDLNSAQKLDPLYPTSEFDIDVNRTPTEVKTSRPRSPGSSHMLSRRDMSLVKTQSQICPTSSVSSHLSSLRQSDPLYPNFEFALDGHISPVDFDTPRQIHLPRSSVTSHLSSSKESDPLYPNFEFDLDGQISPVDVDTPRQIRLPRSSVPSHLSSPRESNPLYPNFVLDSKGTDIQIELKTPRGPVTSNSPRSRDCLSARSQEPSYPIYDIGDRSTEINVCLSCQFCCSRLGTASGRVSKIRERDLTKESVTSSIDRGDCKASRIRQIDYTSEYKANYVDHGKHTWNIREIGCEEEQVNFEPGISDFQMYTPDQC